MFEPNAKSTGTQYTPTVALLAVALIFSPAILLLTGRFGYGPILLAVSTNVLSLLLAWVLWTRNSRMTVPSIQTPFTRSK